MKNWIIILILMALANYSCRNARCEVFGECDHTCPGLDGPANVAGWQVEKVKMSRTDLTGFQFPDTAVGFARTFAGRLSRTTDGGRNWTMLNQSLFFTDPLFFINKNHGWLATPRFANINGGVFNPKQGGQLFETTDGGDTWFVLGDTLKHTFTAMKFRDELTGFAAWNNDSISPGGIFFQRSELLKTTDGGLTWQVIPDVEPAFFSCQFTFFEDKLIYFNGNWPDFWRSTDGGQTWEKRNNQSIFGQTGAFFVNENKGFLSSFGQSMQTENGGNSWLPLPGFLDATVLQFVDENSGIIFAGSRDCSESGAFSFYGTSNGGQSWEESPPIFFDENQFFGNLQRLDFPQKDFGYVVFNQQLLKVRKR